MRNVAAVSSCVASGLLYAAAQPGIGWWMFAGLCLAPLVAALQGRSALGRAGLGWVMGSVGAAATVGPVLFASAVSFFQVGTFAALGLALVVGQIFAALPVALFAVLCGDPSKAHPGVAALRVAASWVTSELFRTIAWTGLPWAFLAHAVTPVPVLLQAASIGGAFLVSFWLAGLNAAVARVWVGPRRRAAVAVVLGIVGAVGVHGVTRLESESSDAKSLRARIVHGGLPAGIRRTGRSHEALARLVEQTRLEPGPIDLALWPENAVGFLLPFNQLPLDRATEPLRANVSHIVLGAPRGDDSDPSRFRNAALLLEPGGGVVQYHDKVKLVPFAEYVPAIAAPLLAWLGVAGPRYVAGERPVVLSAGTAELGPLICYEVIFPRIARQLVLDGAQVLLNLSNDAWLGGTIGSEQHFSAAILRSAELGRPMLRSTSGGVTGAIDARGRVLARIDGDSRDALTVRVTPSSEWTLYARFGDGVAWICVALSVGVLLAQSIPNLRMR